MSSIFEFIGVGLVVVIAIFGLAVATGLIRIEFEKW
jgi:hypothetical protein